jgi:hypothetical protein
MNAQHGSVPGHPVGVVLLGEAHHEPDGADAALGGKTDQAAGQ